jgi:signal transduction histidine kinase
MHPLLADMQKLGLYLVAWLILSVMFIAFLSVSGGMAWQAASALLVPLMLVYSFVCLSAWYPCRSFPLRTTGVLRLVSVFLITAAVSSSAWIVLAGAWRWILAQPEFLGVATGEFDARQLFGLGMLLYLLAAATHYLMITFETSRQSEQRALEARLHANQAELRSLRAQIDPHFLFNSLSSISTLIMRKPEAAREMCLTLAEFLRRSLQYGAKESITLDEELSLACRYLQIEQIRFGARLGFREEADAGARSCLVPPLILQPLIENAVGHGIAHLLDGGTVTVRAGRTNTTLTLAVSNPYDAEKPAGNGSGLGLANVRNRLRTLHGSGAAVRVTDAASVFTVELTLPATEGAPR